MPPNPPPTSLSANPPAPPRSASRPLRLALLAAVAALVLGGIRLGAPPFLPEEAARLLDASSPWSFALSFASSPRMTPEVAARLPSLLAAALAAGLVVLAGARRGAAGPACLLASLSPPLVAAGRLAGPEAFAALLGAFAALLHPRRTPTARLSAVALLLVALVLGSSRTPVIASDRLLCATLGAWGVAFGPGLPPWRLDIAIPGALAVLLLAWLGADGRASARTALLVSLLLLAALAGLLAGRPGAAPLASIALHPFLLAAVASGAARPPGWLPRWLLVAVALGAGGVGIGDLHAERDLLDPARRVAWDEAARMLAVLAEGDAAVAALPDLPAPLRLYAPGRALPLVTPGATVDAFQKARILVVAHGIRGGLAGPTARLEERLDRAGYALKGELLMGELEPGFASLVRRLVGGEPAPAYLRIRRYER